MKVVFNRDELNKSKQLKFIISYRCYTQTKICKELKGISQSNLSKYLKGFTNCLSNEKVEEIVKHLNFPIDFLDRKVNNIKIL